MDFRTIIDIPQSDIHISHQSKILMLGSCFTENMGEHLAQTKFDININPFGILYNPSSIRQSIEILLEKRLFTSDDVFEYKGLYHSFYHHSRFSDTDRDNCLATINNSIRKSVQDLLEADILLITFGTSYVYQLKDNDLIVGNCHKLAASTFNRFPLSVDTIAQEWSDLLSKLTIVNPKLQVIFTISPIRHMKDGAHENQLSKSTLLLAIDKLQQENKNTHYFPSYEIVLDELRDYRFYAEDMVHPNHLAIKYLWKRFSETYFSEETIRIIGECSKIRAAIDHRPFNTRSDEYKQFLSLTKQKIDAIKEKYPYICYNEEVAEVNRRIKDIDSK